MPADAYYNNVSLLLPMNGSNNGTTFTDYSSSVKTVTANGNAKTSTTQFKYYNSSGYFDGTGDRITLGSSLITGTGDFCVEAWVYPSTLSHQNCLWDQRAVPGDAGFAFYIDPSGYIGAWGNDVQQAKSTSAVASATTWQHIAYVWYNGNQYLYHNGSQVGTKSGVWTATSRSDPWICGQMDNATSYLQGYVNDLRITVGQARYTAGFTAPSKLVGTISGTVKDDTNSNAVRTIRAYPRLTSNGYTTTSAADGTWALTVPDTEHTVICLDDSAGTTFNDLIYGRVTPV